METPDRTDAVAGIFRDEESAQRVVAMMVDDQSEGGVIRVDRSPDSQDETAVRRGVATGAVVGTATGVALEGTILAFPPAAIFIAGGTLAAAIAGLTIGTTTGAVAAVLFGRRFLADSPHQLTNAARLRVLVTFSSPDLRLRARARLRMRVGGAIETHDPSDDDTGPVFVRGFATAIPALRADLCGREGTDRRWEQLEHRYRYGWQLAIRPDMEERSWSDATSDIRAEWERRHPSERWSDVAQYVAAGWAAARSDQTEKPWSGNAA